jgi:pyrroloquinoline quinone biosynthesis protein D
MQTVSPDVRPKISPRARLQTDKVTGKPVVLYPEGVLMLNSTAHAIISLCDGTLSIEQIAATLAKRFQNAPLEQIQRDIHKYLNDLRERNLVELVAA